MVHCLMSKHSLNTVHALPFKNREVAEALKLETEWSTEQRITVEV